MFQIHFGPQNSTGSLPTQLSQARQCVARGGL